MNFSNDSNLFATGSGRFFTNSAYIQNEWQESDWKYILQPNQSDFSERNWLETRPDIRTVIMEEPEINLGNTTTKIEIDESDFMHIAIDEMKAELPNELNYPNSPETKFSTWIPPIFQPESPLPTLSDFTFSDILGNLPPVSPPPEEEPFEQFLPEKFSLVKQENPPSVHQPLQDHSLAGIAEVPVSLKYDPDPPEDDTDTLKQDSFSALLIPSVNSAVKAESISYTSSFRLSDENGDETDGDTRSESSWWWQDSSDEEFGNKFEREEHIEQILLNYHRGGINTDDNSVYCDLCNKMWSQNCPHHGKLKTHIKNRQVPIGTRDRAIKTAPHFLTVLKSKICGANQGVWTNKAIPRRTYFGPYEGCVVPTDHPNGDYCWKVKDGTSNFLVDGSDPNKSNWMRYVNCARTVDEQNLEAFQYRKMIYFRTIKDIKAKDELLVWYGYRCAKKLGIRWRDFVESKLPNKTSAVFPCNECFHVYANPIMTQQHKKRQHPKLASSIEPLKVATSPPPSISTNSSMCMEVTTGDRPITCGVCGARFRRRGRPLQNHIKEHTDQIHHCCTRCGQWFPDEISRNEHLTAFAKARKNKTNDVICGINFRVRPKCTKTIIPDPLKRTKEFRSKSATLSTKPMPEVSKKAVTERDTSKFSLCDKCGALFPRKCLLFAHMKKKHDIPFEKKVFFTKSLPAKRFKCTECGVSYRERSTLKSHLKIHEERTSESEAVEDTGKELLFSCKICAMKFRAEITLKYHATIHERVKSHEKAPKKYKCKECNIRFRASSTLDLHVKTHQTKESRRLSRGSASGETLSKKAEEAQSSSKLGCFFTEDEQLKRKIVSSTENPLHKKRRRISPMECLACGFIFKNRNALDVHVLKHTTEKVLVCDLSTVRM